MVNLNKLSAARKFGPGYFIREQMELRQWIHEDLAEILDISVKHLNKILMDKQPITFEMARLLGEVFNTSVQYWINLDVDYRLWVNQKKTEKEQEAQIKSQIYERMPVRDMITRKWIRQPGSVKELVDEVLAFWGWDKLDFTKLDRELIPCLNRKSDAYNQFSASYAATWFRMTQKVAEKFTVPKFDRTKLLKLFDQLYRYTSQADGISAFLGELNRAGVIFFVLPQLRKTYLDGAAFLHGETPVMVYTGRYKRIDHFWFTVAHEMAHVLKHLDKSVSVILDDFTTGVKDTLEDEADQLAAEKLRHKEILEYLDPYLHYLTSAKVEECAEKYQVHPSIIIGKLAHDKAISYRHIYNYNQDVLTMIPGRYKNLF